MYLVKGNPLVSYHPCPALPDCTTEALECDLCGERQPGDNLYGRQLSQQKKQEKGQTQQTGFYYSS
ncbi:hypothetical protein GCM10027098_05810 [Bowmanella dokdonensis]